MNNIIKRVWNQNNMVIIEDLQGMAFQAESGGHTFQISGIDGEGNAVALSGTPAGVLLRADGQDVALTCSASEGVISATLPANAYSVPGRFGLTIFLTSDGQKTAIYAAVGTVGKTSSGIVAPPAGSDVVDLVNAIAAAVATIPASYTDLMASVAPTYSSSGLYAVGSYAWYNGKLYRCTTAITSGETWTSGHWTLANIGSDLVDLKSAINELAGHDFFAFDKTISPNTGAQYLFNVKGLNAGFFVVYFDSYDFTGGGFTFDIKYSDNTHSYPAFNASSNKTKYTAKADTTITEIAVSTTTSSMTAQSSAKGMIIIDAELSEDTLYRLKEAEDNIVSLQSEEAVLDQNVEYYAVSGKLEYTTFVQGKRTSASPSTVIADSARCTAGRLFHLYSGDSLKVSNIANGHKVAIASNTGYDSGWKTADFTFTTSAELYAFVNEAASNGTDSILPGSVTTKVTITDNASRITKNEQQINEVNADLQDKIEMLYGHDYIIFDKTISPNTGAQYLFKQKGLSVDYFYVYLVGYDFTGGGFTFDIKYSDGTHSYPGFNASSNKQKYSAKANTKITEISVSAATQYLTQDSYAKGIIVLDAELTKDTLYRIEELEGKVNNLDAVNSPVMGAMSKNVLSLGLQASHRTVIVGLGETGSFDDAVCESPVVWWDTNKMKYGMVYTGYKYVTGTQNMDAGQIGLAWSDDLIHWTKDENAPILSGSGIEGDPDRGSVTGPVMLMIGDTYYLYYIGCSQPGYEQGAKSLCLATGKDIYNLERYSGNPVVQASGQQGSPYMSYIYHANIYIGETENYMFVNCAGIRPSDQRGSENILLFKSNNMTDWEYDSVAVEGGTDEDDPDYNICGDPCVFDIGDNNFYMTTYQVPKAWTGTKVGLAYTSKKNFPHGWVKLPNQLPTQPNNAKAFIMYRKGEIYVFTSGNVIQLYTEFEINS